MTEQSPSIVSLRSITSVSTVFFILIPTLFYSGNVGERDGTVGELGKWREFDERGDSSVSFVELLLIIVFMLEDIKIDKYVLRNKYRA